MTASPTPSPSAAHALDAAVLQRWLQAHLPGFEGPLNVEKFAGGQSNPTYRLQTPGARYVMRTKPGPAAKLLPSAHAIEREFRVMQALAGTGVPVPRMHVLCTDESVIGRAFYIMEYVDGRVLWDPTLPGMTPEARRAHYADILRVLATLHRVDTAAVGLADYGKPGNYFERQIARWSKQYQASITDPIPEMDALMDWLPRHLPETARDERLVSVVHGDYRLDNLMFAPDAPRVVAVLDWELSTLGHPLADFSYHCLAWHVAPGVFRGMAGLDLAALGIPSEDDYIAQYCEYTGFATPEALRRDWPFYLAYNAFRLAAILQGIAKRVELGIASSAQARQSAAGARPLAELAWQLAQQTR
ncbi:MULTISPECIES: phosphotransferase [unclassified Tepidimonas]|jgi:aminoglycoside phosphotransferase (APT) family kinase protein|uniref:phosphotransferase n=1 Tax=unclassified Tepidimonas TaxID=2631705 RepID=UPI003C7D67F0